MFDLGCGCSAAKTNLGTYNGGMVDQLYPSGSYNDDLAYAAIWMYKITNETKYLDDAKMWWSKARDDGNL